MRNLHYVLTADSALAKLFRKHDVVFDVAQKTMNFAGTIYDVNYNTYRNRCNLCGKDKHLSSIAYRLCKDYCANGFMCNDDYLSYSFDIYIRPEFIIDLVNMFPQLNELDLEWRRKSTSYKVNFYMYLHQVERYNFDLDEYRDPPYENWHDLDDNDKVIKWMLGHAIDRAFDEQQDIILYIQKDLFVPAKQISDCERIIPSHQ